MRALIYTRVSHDQAGGRSPAEQEAEARQVCKREGWDVAHVVTDSVGASRHSKGKRNGWAEAQGMVAARKVDALVTWEASRAQRDLAAYADLRKLCSDSGVLWNYSGRTYDMADGGDRFTTGLDALLAEREADETAGRVQRAIRANAVQGRPHGRRLFGYQRTYDMSVTPPRLTGQESHPTESAVVCRIFRDYLGGQGVRTIARKLNAEGITTGGGATWNDMQVRRVLVNPAYAARRVHQGEIIGEAKWPALVDAETFDRVQARLAAQRTSQTRQTPTARLLSGVGRCGMCGGKVGTIHDRNARKVYTCKAKYEVSRDLSKLDAFVTAVIIERLSRPDVAEALGDTAPDPAVIEARRLVAELTAQLDSAVASFVAGKLTAATLAKVEVGLLPAIAEAEAVVRRALVPIDIDVPDDVAGWWDGLSTDLRREIVGTLLSAVVILPTKRGSRSFDPDAVRVEWRR